LATKLDTGGGFCELGFAVGPAPVVLT